MLQQVQTGVSMRVWHLGSRDLYSRERGLLICVSWPSEMLLRSPLFILPARVFLKVVAWPLVGGMPVFCDCFKPLKSVPVALCTCLFYSHVITELFKERGSRVGRSKVKKGRGQVSLI